MPPVSSRTQTIPAGIYKWIKPCTGVDVSTNGSIQLDTPFVCDGTSYEYASVEWMSLQYGVDFYPYKDDVWVDTKYQAIALPTDGEWIVSGTNSTWVNSSDQDYTNYLELTGGGTPMKIYLKDGKALKANGKFIAPAGVVTSETWVLNETIPVPESLLIGEVTEITYDAPEFSWGTGDTATSIKMYYEDAGGGEYVLYYGDIFVVNATINDNLFPIDDEYRTLTFTSSPTGDLLTWLQENGTKQ